MSNLKAHKHIFHIQCQANMLESSFLISALVIGSKSNFTEFKGILA